MQLTLTNRLRLAALERAQRGGRVVGTYVIDDEGVIDLRALEDRGPRTRASDPASLHEIAGMFEDAGDVSDLYSQEPQKRGRFRRKSRATVTSTPAGPVIDLTDDADGAEDATAEDPETIDLTDDTEEIDATALVDDTEAAEDEASDDDTEEIDATDLADDTEETEDDAAEIEDERSDDESAASAAIVVETAEDDDHDEPSMETVGIIDLTEPTTPVEAPPDGPVDARGPSSLQSAIAAFNSLEPLEQPELDIESGIRFGNRGGTTEPGSVELDDFSAESPTEPVVEPTAEVVVETTKAPLFGAAVEPEVMAEPAEPEAPVVEPLEPEAPVVEPIAPEAPADQPAVEATPSGNGLREPGPETLTCPMCGGQATRDFENRFLEIDFYSCGDCFHMWHLAVDEDN